MKKINLFSIVFLFSGVVVGCAPSVENCNTPEILELLVETVRDEMADQVSAEAAEELIYEVRGITIIEIDADTGVPECSAELMMSNDSRKEAKPITYSVEKNSNGQLHINVVGLK